MFVLSTRYEKALSEKQHLANSVTELSAQIKNLQASNDQAYADAQAKHLRICLLKNMNGYWLLVCWNR
jgi:hypothetical protein